MDRHSALLRSTSGRIVVGIVLVVVGAWIVLPNLPASPVRTDIDVLWQPADRIGLAQDWAVFSPDPRDQSLDVRAEITHADGTVEWWDVPDLDPAVGAYRQYRWNKWQERVRLDARRDLWEPTARWIAAEHARDGAAPVRVRLIRRWIDHLPLTAEGAIDVPPTGWNEFVFHVWEPGS